MTEASSKPELLPQMNQPGVQANINPLQWKRVSPEFLQLATSAPDQLNAAPRPWGKAEWPSPEST